jgi:hypothetical protein
MNDISQYVDLLPVRDTAAWVVEQATHVKLIQSNGALSRMRRDITAAAFCE